MSIDLVFGYNSVRSYIIAEIGINHEGSFLRCKELVNAAMLSGADAVKLQTIDADECYTSQSDSYMVFKNASLTRDETTEIFEYAKSIGLDVMTTVGDKNTLSWVDALDPVAYKISSGLLNHVPLIEEIAALDKPIILSTGIADLSEIDCINALLKNFNVKKYAYLHCISFYPPKINELNLNCIKTMSERYEVPIGYSDHCIGYDAVRLSIALGARIIEKHFTFSSKREGYDHKISLDPDGFKEMVDVIRSTELMLGTGEKILSEKLSKRREVMARFLVARSSIKKGDIFTSSNISVKRVVSSSRKIEPSDISRILGNASKKNYNKDEVIHEG